MPPHKENATELEDLPTAVNTVPIIAAIIAYRNIFNYLLNINRYWLMLLYTKIGYDVNRED